MRSGSLSYELCHPHPWPCITGAEIDCWKASRFACSSCSRSFLRRYARITTSAMPTYATVASPTIDPMIGPLELCGPAVVPTGFGRLPVSGSAVTSSLPPSSLLSSPLDPFPDPDRLGGWLLSGYVGSKNWPKVLGPGMYSALTLFSTRPCRV